jgi:hypothetical protein
LPVESPTLSLTRNQEGQQEWSSPSRVLGDEVLQIDLFAFAILQSKFPRIVDEIRKNPELFVEDPLDPAPYFAREGLAKKEGAEIITSVFGDVGSTTVLEPLLVWLFPLFSEGEAIRIIEMKRLLFPIDDHS